MDGWSIFYTGGRSAFVAVRLNCSDRASLGVPTVHQFLAEKLEKSMCLGFDGRTVSAKEAEELEKLLEEKKYHICCK